MSSGCSGAVARTLSSACGVAEGYVGLAECSLLYVHVARSAAFAALGNTHQYSKGWKVFCGETA